MTEAVQPILNYAFNELGFRKLAFANAVQNKASRRIKEKTGCQIYRNKTATASKSQIYGNRNMGTDKRRLA